MTIRIQWPYVDSTGPARLAAFWQEVLGWRRTHEEKSEGVLEPPSGSVDDGVVPDLLLLKVPEAKSVKNRRYLDLRPDDELAELTRLEKLDARRVSVGQGDDVSWIVMADPEGNEFNVLKELRPSE